MPINVYKAALKTAQDYGEYIVLGGGEPTLHPEFEKYLLLAISASLDSDLKPLIITNGSIKERALLLAKLGDHKIIYSELSQDSYHDPIDEEVIRAFGKRIRNTELSHSGIISAGYATTNLFDDEIPEDQPCCCSEWQVKPNGDVYQCGCNAAPKIGNVLSKIDENFELGKCFRENE